MGKPLTSQYFTDNIVVSHIFGDRIKYIVNGDILDDGCALDRGIYDYLCDNHREYKRVVIGDYTYQIVPQTYEEWIISMLLSAIKEDEQSIELKQKRIGNNRLMIAKIKANEIDARCVTSSLF